MTNDNKVADKCKRYKNKGKGHHWLIENPNGTYSDGKCKYCKAKRIFRNSIEYSTWTNWTNSIRYSKKDNKKLSSSEKGAV